MRIPRISLFQVPTNPADRRPYMVTLCLYWGLVYVSCTEMAFPLLNTMFNPVEKLPTVASEWLLGLLLTPALHWMTSRGVEKVKGVSGDK